MSFSFLKINLVPRTRIELVMTGYQPIVIPFNYPGKLAEVVGFEPTDPFEPSVFKTAALSHAQPYFHYLAPRVRIERTTSSLTAKRNYLCAIGELIGGDYWDRTSRARRRRIYSPLHHH